MTWTRLYVFCSFLEQNALGREDSVFLSPLDRISTAQQETDSLALCFAADVTIPSLYQKHLDP